MKTNTYSISNTRKMVLNSILLAIGLILHQITPALALPMQPDFALITMFIVILLNKDDYKSCLLAGIVTGVFTALTTKFPGGQIPNIIDKIISANLGFIFIYLMYKLPFLKKLNKINSFILLSVGTFLSGFIFLLSAKYIVGLPAGFNLLLITIVVPSVVINLIVGIILYNIVIRCIK